MDEAFRKKLLEALTLEVPYAERGGLSGGVSAAVLILMGPSRDLGGELAALITRRTDLVGSHKGQMAFPGGKSEPGELGSEEGLILTALRETEEEVGVPGDAVEVLGTLPALVTITGFEVTPVVGLLRMAVEEVVLRPNETEIAEALWVPMRKLWEPETYQTEYRRIGAVNYPIHVYQVGDHRIWGATGSMIKNLLDRLRALS